MSVTPSPPIARRIGTVRVLLSDKGAVDLADKRRGRLRLVDSSMSQSVTFLARLMSTVVVDAYVVVDRLLRFRVDGV